MKKEILENITLEKQSGSLVAFTGEIAFEELEKHRAGAVAEVAKNIEVDGFRKGHVPEAVLVKRVGEMAILTEMAERTLSHVYPELIALHTLDVIGYPKISITKLAPGNPLGFTITVAVVPIISLPDYTKIANEINATKESKDVSDEEVTKQIEDILRQKIAYERLQSKSQKNADETKMDAENANKTQKDAEEHIHGEDCDHDHDHEEHDHEPHEVDATIELPELTDEYVKGLGKEGQFTSVEDFKSKIREHLTLEKAREIDSRHRAKITDAIIEKTTMELPQVLIDAEIGQMFGQMEEDLKRAQLKMEDYLAHIKKTREDLMKEWMPSAEKRAKLQLVLNEIAKQDKIEPNAGQVDHEVSHLLEHYKDADEKRVRVYVASVLTNEAVLKKLENM